MRVADLDWKSVERYLERDDRAVLPVGSTEQHAYLSLCTDNILAERVAVDAAEPLGVPVFPVVSYGITPYFRAYPGSVTLRVETFLSILRDILDSLESQGFRRIVIVNGHGGNAPAQALAGEWTADHPGKIVKFHNWWNAPLTLAKVRSFDPMASHASWMENFPWTRLADVAMPAAQKPMVDWPRIQTLGPARVREQLGDGNFGGLYQRPDEEMLAIWSVAVEETRALIAEGWD
jgi:creatinine amidohydrolase